MCRAGAITLKGGAGAADVTPSAGRRQIARTSRSATSQLWTYANGPYAALMMLCCGGTVIPREGKVIFNLNNLNDILDNEFNYEVKQQSSVWQNHVQDFLDLVNLEKVLSTALGFIDDPEVLRFIGFLLSPKFKDIAWELESMDEFKEAYIFLNTKGYDLKPVIDIINSGLSLPEFNRPSNILRYNTGMSGFIAAMFGAVPIEDMKNLLETKIKNDPEVAEFVEVLNSVEFKDIMTRMMSSPKIIEIKSIFESYGVDFAFLCHIFKEYFGEEIVCEVMNK
ncbi:unnamed protein product, partial [Brenthis ino]